MKSKKVTFQELENGTILCGRCTASLVLSKLLELNGGSSTAKSVVKGLHTFAHLLNDLEDDDKENLEFALRSIHLSIL
jgi:hypothetical protein